jgi:signal peptidase I
VNQVTIAWAAAAPEQQRRPGWVLFTAGILGRTWLWFVGGCIAITLLPVLLGWRPFVVESGSMEPRINVGDVILAAPVNAAADLVGRVAVFDDPDRPGAVKSHRIVAVNPDGTLTSRGDANPTDDSSHVAMSDVRGLGRLLVAFAGLPLIWAQTGQWLLFALFLLSLVLAGWVVSRDRDPEEPDEPDPTDGADAEVVPLPSARGGAATTIAATTPLDPGLQRRARGRPRAATRVRREPSAARRTSPCS